jgi:tocopherol O-methyltransferase
MVPRDLKHRIQRHYDIAAPLYRSLWGIHIHHGYWHDGTETKEVAQEQLTALLADTARIANGCRVLDIGCGFGGSARYLAQRFGARVVGISISKKQIEIANAIARGCEPAPRFFVTDAEQLGIATKFDVVWSIEAISHLSQKKECFRHFVELLRSNGRIAIIDWFKAEGLSNDQEHHYIEPIVRQMLLPELKTMQEYASALESLACRIVEMQDITRKVAKTWDLCLGIRRMPSVLIFALAHGSDLIRFLHGFAAMKAGFDSGAFRCGMLIAEKNA